jgi:hypothetical protein
MFDSLKDREFTHNGVLQLEGNDARNLENVARALFLVQAPAPPINACVADAKKL